MTLLVAAVYLIPPIIAVALALYAKSNFARMLLLFAACTFILIFVLLLVPNTDCTYQDFTFMHCTRLSATVGELFGVMQILYVLAYLLAVRSCWSSPPYSKRSRGRSGVNRPQQRPSAWPKPLS